MGDAMGMITGINLVTCPLTPLFADPPDNPFYRFGIIVNRTKIPPFCKFTLRFVKFLRKHQIS